VRHRLDNGILATDQQVDSYADGCSEGTVHGRFRFPGMRRGESIVRPRVPMKYASDRERASEISPAVQPAAARAHAPT
jgi:hypothetical protein